MVDDFKFFGRCMRGNLFVFLFGVYGIMYMNKLGVVKIGKARMG